MTGLPQLVMPRHLFLCQNGDMLPRWEQAFPKAKAVQPEQANGAFPEADLAWLRLKSGFAVSEQIDQFRQQAGPMPLIILSDVPRDDEALSAFARGARGYCNSHADPAILRQIANVVMQGGIWIGEGIMQRLMNVVEKLPTPQEAAAEDWAAPLTSREKEVAQAVAAGASNREIASQLSITERTVKAHVGTILTKLQVRDRLQLALLISGQQRRL